MRKLFIYLFLMVALFLVLGACGGTAAVPEGETGPIGETEPGDPVRGEALYKQNPVGAASSPGCMTCHSLEEGQDLVGPSHFAVGAAAASRVSGQSAEAYLREAIVDPDVYVVEGYSKSGMIRSYGNELTDQEIEDMVAFLLSLK
jgi:cytochrome c2